jgi:hypothetical protein
MKCVLAAFIMRYILKQKVLRQRHLNDMNKAKSPQGVFWYIVALHKAIGTPNCLVAHCIPFWSQL